MAHTATPWKVEGTEIVTGVVSPRGAPWEISYLLGKCFSDADYVSVETAHANAAHIVRCVNAHDELVEILAGIVCIHPDKNNEPLLQGLLDEAKAALAKARA